MTSRRIRQSEPVQGSAHHRDQDRPLVRQDDGVGPQRLPDRAERHLPGPRPRPDPGGRGGLDPTRPDRARRLRVRRRPGLPRQRAHPRRRFRYLHALDSWSVTLQRPAMKHDRKELAKKAGHLASTHEDVGRRTHADNGPRRGTASGRPLKPGSPGAGAIRQHINEGTDEAANRRSSAMSRDLFESRPWTPDKPGRASLAGVETIFGRFGVLLPF